MSAAAGDADGVGRDRQVERAAAKVSFARTRRTSRVVELIGVVEIRPFATGNVSRAPNTFEFYGWLLALSMMSC